MRVIGIDENGLGPLLGPLVVTAVTFEAPAYERAAFWELAKPPFLADDSKKLFVKAKRQAAEQATLAWLSAFAYSPSSFLELKSQICTDQPNDAPCGKDTPPYCRSAYIALPAFSPAAPLSPAKAIAEQVANWVIKPISIQAIFLCAGAFNKALSRPEMNKLRLDFELMIDLAEKAAAPVCGDAHILCGKVGSMRNYATWLESRSKHIDSILVESAEQSCYQIAGLGHLAFIKDADAAHLPVAVASMVGKYLRELFMLDLNRRLGTARMKPASGYRDPVTAEFVNQTAALRQELGLPDSCFLRRS